MTVVIRDMEARDVAPMTDLHNREAVATTASYHLVEASVTERTAWWRELVADGRPVLVAEVDGQAVGYACHHRFRDLPGYDPTGEVSIWLEPQWRGQGVGSALMARLVDLARRPTPAEGDRPARPPLHSLVAVIDSDNRASLAFHAHHGFAERGRLPQAARKFGQWREVVICQLLLDPPAGGPSDSVEGPVG